MSQDKKAEHMEVMDDSFKLASILDMFPDKSYREVQRKFAETGSVEDTVSAFLGFCKYCIYYFFAFIDIKFAVHEIL